MKRTCRPDLALNSATNRGSNCSMSSLISLSGGSVRRKTLRRWYKSLRKSPSRDIFSKSRLLAATIWTSTAISRSPPSLRILRSSMALSTLACKSSGISPISSKNNVPLSACSISPRWRPVAPVNAPASWPNNSDSNSSRGRAAQLSSMSGFCERGPE